MLDEERKKEEVVVELNCIDTIRASDALRHASLLRFMGKRARAHIPQSALRRLKELKIEHQVLS